MGLTPINLSISSDTIRRCYGAKRHDGFLNKEAAIWITKRFPFAWALKKWYSCSDAIVSLLHLRPPQENAEPMVDGFTLVEGPVGFWHLKTQQEEGREVLAIEPVTAQENRKRIAALISSAAKQG